MKRWIKNGVFASDTIELNECVVCNPTEDMLKQAGYKEYQEPVPTESEKLEQAKVEKIAEIIAYDTSDKVNGFMLNGLLVWLDKATPIPWPTAHAASPWALASTSSTAFAPTPTQSWTTGTIRD